MVVFQKNFIFGNRNQYISHLQTDSTVLGIEYNKLSEFLLNYSDDTERDNKTKYVYFILITVNGIVKSILLFFDHSICFISGYWTA